MVFGLLFYVVYRKVFEGTTLTKRVSVPEHALTKQVPEVEFRNILVPVFGTKFDDDIVSTAGRLAAASRSSQTAATTSRLEVVYVIEVPLTLPLDAGCPRSARTKPSGRWRGPARSARSTRTLTSPPR